MLQTFVSRHRDELITFCRAKTGRRSTPKATVAQLERGIPLFIDQLIEALRLNATSSRMQSQQVSGGSGGEPLDTPDIGDSAAKHGNELQQRGFTVEQVVHEYGDLCQAIAELAVKESAQITAGEFRILNRCLAQAITGAVSEFIRQRDLTLSEERARAANQRMSYFAHELRNLLGSAMLLLTVIKEDEAGFAGAAAAALDRSLMGLRDFIDRMLVETRVSAGMPSSQEAMPLLELAR